MTNKLIVDDTQITVLSIDENDYISLIDMIKAKDGDFFISDRLRNRNCKGGAFYGRKQGQTF